MYGLLRKGNAHDPIYFYELFLEQNFYDAPLICLLVLFQASFLLSVLFILCSLPALSGCLPWFPAHFYSTEGNLLSTGTVFRFGLVLI